MRWPLLLLLLRTVVMLPLFMADTLFDGAIGVVQLEDMGPVRSTTEPWVVNFYSPWCGHCREYAPVFRAFGEASVHTGLHVGVVSCARHKDVCASEGIEGWPTLRAYGRLADDGASQEIVDVDKLEAFVAKRMPKVEFGKGFVKKVDELHYFSPSATPAVVVENAGASVAYAMETAVFVGKEPSLTKERATLLRTFLQTVSVALPVIDIAKPLAERLQSEEEPPTESEWRSLVKKAESKPRPLWTPLCDPKKEGQEGTAYNCGLWLTFHALADRTSSRISVADASEALRIFVDHSFACTSCRTHFLRTFDRCDYDRPLCAAEKEDSKKGPLSSSSSSSSSSSRRKNGREVFLSESDRLVLWLWKVHNSVNARVHGKVAVNDKEAFEAYDVNKPGNWAFPSADLCPDCRRNSSFDTTKVLAFLRHYYGEQHQKKKNSIGQNYYLDDDDDDDQRQSAKTITGKALFLLITLSALITFLCYRSGALGPSSLTILRRPPSFSGGGAVGGKSSPIIARSHHLGV